MQQIAASTLLIVPWCGWLRSHLDRSGIKLSGCPCVVCPGSGSGSTTSQLVNVLHLQTKDKIEYYSDYNIVSIPHSPLCHGPEHRVVPTDGGPVLVVLCFGVANLVELRLKRVSDGLLYVESDIFTVDANILPPNQTAYLCIWCWMTWTSIGFG